MTGPQPPALPPVADAAGTPAVLVSVRSTHKPYLALSNTVLTQCVEPHAPRLTIITFDPGTGTARSEPGCAPRRNHHGGPFAAPTPANTSANPDTQATQNNRQPRCRVSTDCRLLFDRLFRSFSTETAERVRKSGKPPSLRLAVGTPKLMAAPRRSRHADIAGSVGAGGCNAPATRAEVLVREGLPRRRAGQFSRRDGRTRCFLDTSPARI